jgi:hypothetical protein
MTAVDRGVTGRKVGVTQKTAFSLAEFCERNSISRAFHYKLRKAGKAVRVSYAGNKPIVTVDDERAWQQSLGTEPTDLKTA